LQLEALGIQACVCENASTALELMKDHHFDLMLTDQSMPGMQGSELAKQIRFLGNRDLIIIGVTADIYALDSRHQFLSSGMNGVLIKPLSLGALENELLRYFDSSNPTICVGEDYSFNTFEELIKDDPKQIIVILEEIEKVHQAILSELASQANKTEIDEAQFQSLVHKVKGGAQLLEASQFISACKNLGCDILFGTPIFWNENAHVQVELHSGGNSVGVGFAQQLSEVRLRDLWLEDLRRLAIHQDWLMRKC
jgi:two-component system sensor histidine kinase EvgS